MQIKPIRGTRLNLTHPLATGLVGGFLCNEGTGNHIYDISGHDKLYLGAFDGNVQWVPGKTGYVLSFDGTESIVKLKTWNMPSGIFTIAARVKYSDVIGLDGQICAADSDSSSLRAFQFKRVASAGELRFTVFVAGSPIATTSSTILTTGDWWDVVAVTDGVTSAVYVSGLQETSTTTGVVDNDGAAWCLAGRATYSDFTGLVEVLQGDIEYLYVWDRALNGAEVKDVCLTPYAMFEQTFSPAWFYVAPTLTGRISRYHNLNGLGGQGQMTWNPLG